MRQIMPRWCHKAPAIALLSAISTFSFAIDTDENALSAMTSEQVSTQAADGERLDAMRTIVKTSDPFNGPFGLWGFDVSKKQSVAARFTPEKNYSLQEIKLWFMNNDWSGELHGTVMVTLREDKPVDGGKSIPSDLILEAWTLETTASGWNPVEETLVSQVKPRLKAGKNYWVAVSSQDEGGVNAVWNISSDSYGYVSNTQIATGEWMPVGGDTGAALTLTVKGTRLRQ